MDDILHILELLRQRAEADILLLNTKKNNCLTKISDITIAIDDEASAVSNTEGLTTVDLSSGDMCIFEQWRQNQIHKIRALEKKIDALDEDITKAKAHFKSVLTKSLTAKAAAKNILHTKRLSAEETELSAQLDVLLLQSNK